MSVMPQLSSWMAGDKDFRGQAVSVSEFVLESDTLIVSSGVGSMQERFPAPRKLTLGGRDRCITPMAPSRGARVSARTAPATQRNSILKNKPNRKNYLMAVGLGR